MYVFFVQFTSMKNIYIYICNVLHEMLYANYNTKAQQTPTAKWSERPKPKPSETKTKSQTPWAISQVKPSEAKAKSQKPSGRANGRF